MTYETALDDFEPEYSSDGSRSLALEEQFHTPISPTVGLRLIPGRDDRLYLQNRGTERYLFRDEHDRWFVLHPSAKDSKEAFARWVFLPEDPPTTKPSRVAIDETAAKINGDRYWTYDAIVLDPRLIFDVVIFEQGGIDPAATFLYRLTEKHDLSETVSLVDQFGYRTAASRLELSGRIDYTDRNLIEK